MHDDTFDWRGFASAVMAAIRADGRGLRAIAGEIGVSMAALSRASGGTTVSVGNALTIAHWADIDLAKFHNLPKKHPAKSDCFTMHPVKPVPLASRGQARSGGAGETSPGARSRAERGCLDWLAERAVQGTGFGRSPQARPRVAPVGAGLPEGERINP